MREQSLRPLEESQRQDTGAIPGTPLTGSETVAPASLLCLMRDFEIGVGEKVVSEKQQDPSHWMEMEAIPNHPSLFCAELFRSTVKPPLERRRQKAIPHRSMLISPKQQTEGIHCAIPHRSMHLKPTPYTLNSRRLDSSLRIIQGMMPLASILASRILRSISNITSSVGPYTPCAACENQG